MKTYHVKVAIVRTLEIYAIQAEDAETATESWAEGDLIHTNDEVMDRIVLSVKEV